MSTPTKPPPKKQQQQQQQKPKPSSTKKQNANSNANSQPAIPENEVKQSSSISAQLALEAAKKAYELRQAAYGAGDPDAREDILAKAIDKEIEAESFGKAAKYTRSGAFQGLAAGAGLGVQPGVTLGKLTGALVGGVVASVGAVVGGGIGSAYGAMNGPFWNLGQIASQGVRSIVGDFPNWKATSSQKKALEKMVMGAQKTKAPNQEELEEMRDDNGGMSPDSYEQFVSELKSWVPSMPSMPNMPNMSSIPGFGGQSQDTAQKSAGNRKSSNTKSNQPQQARSKPQSTGGSEPKNQANSNSGGSTYQPQEMSMSKDTSSEPIQKKKPKKLEIRSNSNTSQATQAPAKKAPPKLEKRSKPVTAGA